MIEVFPNDSIELEKSFRAWKAAHSQIVGVIAEYVERAPQGHIIPEQHSDQLAAYLARANNLVADADGFKNNAFQCLRRLRGVYGHSPVLRDSEIMQAANLFHIECKQAWTVVDRLRSTLTHSLGAISARIAKRKAELQLEAAWVRRGVAPADKPFILPPGGFRPGWPLPDSPQCKEVHS